MEVQEQLLLQDMYDHIWDGAAVPLYHGGVQLLDPFIDPSHPMQSWDWNATPIAHHQLPEQAPYEHAVPSGPPLSIPPVKPRCRGTRRQNHSCDPCRTAKRACDLSPETDIPSGTHVSVQSCSMCKARGVECTVLWLARRKSAKRTSVATQRASQVVAVAAATITTPAIAMESELALQVATRNICDMQFELYVDIFDMPLSQCILPGSMSPRHHLGAAAFSLLSESAVISTQFNKASEWINSCGRHSYKDRYTASLDSIPHIFRTVSMLDAIFQQAPRWRVSESRNTAITEAYRWVAIASVSQYSPIASKQPLGTGDVAAGLGRSLAAFRRARDMVFNNISAVTSFRLAFSMLILGSISPPGEGEEKQRFQEDTSFALGEGMRRLRLLCTRAKDILQGADLKGPLYEHLKLSSNTSQLVLELIASVEWLTHIINVSIVASSRRISFTPHAYSLSTTPVQRDTSIQLGSSYLSPILLKGDDQEEAENAIVARAAAYTKSFIAVWKTMKHEEFVCLVEGSADRTFIAGTRCAASMTVMLWKTLASLTVATEVEITTSEEYAEIERLYERMGELIELWRNFFGTFDFKTKLNVPRAPPNSCRMFKFCSNDADLAILLFCDLGDDLERRLAMDAGSAILSRQHLLRTLRDDQTRRSAQQLVSAIQVATISQKNTAEGHVDDAFDAHRPISSFARNISMYPVSSHIQR